MRVEYQPSFAEFKEGSRSDDRRVGRVLFFLIGAVVLSNLTRRMRAETLVGGVPRAFMRGDRALTSPSSRGYVFGRGADHV